ncbi:MAG: FAD:protein FMN transferase [Granulosicoccaceae bacterium]
MSTRKLEFVRKTPGYAGRFFAMASPCELMVHSEDPTLARHICETASQEAWRIEDRYSRYRNDNLVYQINNARGTELEVDTELALLLNFAQTCWQLSDGAFDITSGVLRRAWHFNGGSGVPSQSTIDTLLPLIGWDKVQWDGKKLCMPTGMEIDLGGIGKEYAVDRAALLVTELSDVPILINFGGDLRANRPPLGARAWQVGIENHAGSGTHAVLELAAGSLATSGDARRFVLKDGIRYGHVLNPHTGWPVVDAPNSVTVGRGQCIEAGLLSTLALLKGADAEVFLKEQNCVHWVYR